MSPCPRGQTVQQCWGHQQQADVMSARAPCSGEHGSRGGSAHPSRASLVTGLEASPFGAFAQGEGASSPLPERSDAKQSVAGRGHLETAPRRPQGTLPWTALKGRVASTRGEGDRPLRNGVRVIRGSSHPGGSVPAGEGQEKGPLQLTRAAGTAGSAGACVARRRDGGNAGCNWQCARNVPRRVHTATRWAELPSTERGVPS